MIREDRRWDGLRDGLESDLETADERVSALGDLGVPTDGLVARTLELVRDRRDGAATWPEDDGDSPFGLAITELRIVPKKEGRLRALCTVTFENAFVVRGVKIIEGPDRHFLAMPSRREADGKYHDICHPVKKEFRCWLENKIVAAYHQHMEKARTAPRKTFRPRNFND